MQIELIKAEEKDFSQIAALAHSIWNKHYVPIIGQQQVDYMLGSIYNLENLVEQTKTKQHVFYLIYEKDKNSALGFVSISSDANKNFWIHKFYILNEEQNKGLGSAVFSALVQVMQAPNSIRLTVNRQNYKSINFYFKNGFKIEEVADFDIGNGYFMNDFVMLWKNPKS